MRPSSLLIICAGFACSGGDARNPKPASSEAVEPKRALSATHRLTWRELRWIDLNFASLKDGPRVRSVVRDSESYARMWHEVVQDTSTPPPVDFHRQLVLLLAAPSQTRGGYAIAVDSVFVRGGSDTIVVSVREIAPGQYCTEPDDGSRPILVGTIPITSSEIQFLNRQTQSNCAH